MHRSAFLIVLAVGVGGAVLAGCGDGTESSGGGGAADPVAACLEAQIAYAGVLAGGEVDDAEKDATKQTCDAARAYIEDELPSGTATADLRASLSGNTADLAKWHLDVVLDEEPEESDEGVTPGTAAQQWREELDRLLAAVPTG